MTWNEEAPPPGFHPDSIVLTYKVADEHAGMRLDRFVQHRIPRLSRTRAADVVRRCAVYPDGRKRRPADRVRAGETVWIVRPPMNEPEAPQYFSVTYEDDHVLVIDKPPGLPMHPTASAYRNTLAWLLKVRYPDRMPQFAHRLDKETSGLVICGWTSADEIALKKCFESRRNVAKEYVAIVEGVMAKDRGEIDEPLGRKEHKLDVMMEVRGDGLSAFTSYEVMDRTERHTFVRLFPKSGRQHQLRVHLAHLGHPIVGDKLYGPHGPELFLRFVEGERSDELLSLLDHPRQALHAEKLNIMHPTGAGIAEFEVPMAWDMRWLWNRLTDQSEVPMSFDALVRGQS